MIVGHSIGSGQPVPAIGVLREISIGEPQIRLIRGLVGILGLEVERVLRTLPGKLGNVILDLITRVLF